MGILDRFEQRVDRLVNGAFARAFEAEVQPIEIAAALQNETTDRAVMVSPGRTVVPNRFTVDLAPVDYQRLAAYADTLKSELAAVVREHIAEQRYTTLGQVSVSLNLDLELSTGVFRVNADARESGNNSEVLPDLTGNRGPHIVIDGFSHMLTKQKTVLGRGTDVDIRVDDSSVSRHHCEIVLGVPPRLVDLGSTNGTWVHGHRISSTIELTDDVDITLGNSVLQYRAR